MRLVKVAAPSELKDRIIETAFAAGLEDVTLRQVQKVSREGGSPETLQVIDVETSTPLAKVFVDMILAADYYDPKRITINTRQPRSLIADRSDRDLTVPLVEPATDLYQELWQFSHVTFGFVGRILFGGCLLAYGLIEGKLLLIISGLLFLPLLPLVMAISFGTLGRRRDLALQGMWALTVGTGLLLASGVLIALISASPMRFDDLPSPVTGFVICIGVGIAATLAAEDDAGRRELIGLAAGAQIGMLPVVFGVRAIFGPSSIGPSIVEIGGIFLLNVLTIAISAFATQYITGVVGKIQRPRRS